MTDTPSPDNGLADELERIDARLRAVPTQDECSAAVNDLLAFMDKAAPTILAALRANSIESKHPTVSSNERDSVLGDPPYVDRAERFSGKSEREHRRDSALEEAATVAETTFIDRANRIAGECIATAIRALKVKPTTTDGEA